jgi:hypothetical protein
MTICRVCPSSPSMVVRALLLLHLDRCSVLTCIPVNITFALPSSPVPSVAETRSSGK